MTAVARTIVNAMSVDVEDYFQVSAFESHIPRGDWDSLECRVERNTMCVLQLFDSANVKATFFVLGWVAERYPRLIHEIVSNGHEVASHGMSHIRATEQTENAFAEDVSRSRRMLQDFSGQPVIGYRAASFSFSRKTLWAHDVLAEAGYKYSSSVYPVRHDIYGDPTAPRFAYRDKGSGLLEVPISTIRAVGRNWPCGGGGFFRLLPLAYTEYGVTRLNEAERQPAVFYFHPWELDPGQPRIGAATWKSKIRHYTNIERMEAKLRRMLAGYRWGRLDEVYACKLVDRPN